MNIVFFIATAYTSFNILRDRRSCAMPTFKTACYHSRSLKKPYKVIINAQKINNGKTYIPIVHYKIISITIIISINNDRVLGLGFYNSKISLYTNMSVF